MSTRPGRLVRSSNNPGARVGGWVAQAMWSRLRRLCGGWVGPGPFYNQLWLSQVSQLEPSVAINGS